MKLEKFQEKDKKKIGIFVFTVACILLVSGVVLYRTFAIFEVKTNQNVINGSVQDPGNIYFAFYKDNSIQKNMPSIDEGYVLDENASFCGVNGSHDDSITVSVTEDYTILVHGVTTSRTKCTLYFVKGKFIQSKGIPIAKEGDGLYEVLHSAEETLSMDDRWQETEYRYAGANPNNYVLFNNELWRIIGLVNVKTSSSSIEKRLKIIRNESLGNFSWDYNGSLYYNNWTESSLMQMLNGIYFDNSNGNCWKGDNTGNPKNETCNFNGTDENTRGLKEVQNMIDQDIIWNIAGNETENNATVFDFYIDERGIKTGNELYPSEWTKENTIKDATFHSIGLIYPSDYGWATNGGSLGRRACFEKELHNWDDDYYQIQCGQNNWLKPISSNPWAWTITSYSLNPYYAYLLDANGSVHRSHSQDTRNVFPSLYLKTNVKILNDGQDGSEEKPYHLITIS